MQAANLPQFEKALLDALSRAKEQLPLSNGWKESDTNKKLGLVNHTKRDEKFSAGVTRGEGIININAKKLVEILRDTTQVQKMESRLKESKLISKTPAGYEVRLQIFSSPMGDDREAITIEGVIEENGVFYVAMTSIDHPEYEQVGKGRVRCAHYYHVFQIVPQGEQTSNVTIVHCFDPKGSIPDFVKSKMDTSRGIGKIEQIVQLIA